MVGAGHPIDASSAQSKPAKPGQAGLWGLLLHEASEAEIECGRATDAELYRIKNATVAAAQERRAKTSLVEHPSQVHQLLVDFLVLVRDLG